MRQVEAAILGALVLGGCDPSSDDGSRACVEVRDSAGIEIVTSTAPAWSAAERWTLSAEPLFVLHGSNGTAADQLLDPSSIDVDSQGRVLVADGFMAGWHAVLVHDSLGRFLFRAGGPGRGPGEFRSSGGRRAYRGDSIAAYDMVDQKLSIFEPGGRFVRQVRLPPLVPMQRPPGTYGSVPGVEAVYGDGSFLASPGGTLDISGGPGPAWYTHPLIRLAPDGERSITGQLRDRGEALDRAAAGGGPVCADSRLGGRQLDSLPWAR